MLVELIVGSIDVADTLKEFSHLVKTCSCESIVTYLQTSDFVDASCSMDVFDHFIAFQVAIGNIEKIA